MARILQSRDLYAMMDSGELDANAMHWAYNALDSAVTLRVWERLTETIAKQNTPHARTSYQFVRAMQGPALSMMRRGIAVQTKVRQDETERYLNIRNTAQALLDRLADALWGPEQYDEIVKTLELYTPLGKHGRPLTARRRVVRTSVGRTRPRGLNPNSDKQVLAFFNTALGYPVEYEIRKKPTGSERTPSANNKALRKWALARKKGPGVDVRDRTVPSVRLAAPFVSLILAIRDADKMLGVLRTPLDPDGRMRCSYNVVGTETGRWSSSKNAFGRGTNFQNITPSMRRMFCADDGQWFISTDLEQAEPRTVAGLVWQTTGDTTYLDACDRGDIHSEAAAMSWPEFTWPDTKEGRRAVADEPCREFPEWTYREVCKRLSNGTNYDGSAFGLAQEVGIPHTIVQGFQERWFGAFPAIRTWQAEVKDQLRNHQFLDTPLGRRRWFFGRPEEAKTHRDGIAFLPQSTIGELLNLIMYKVWKRSLLPPTDPAHLPIQLLLQNHDAFAFQTPTSTNLAEVINSVNGEFNTTPIPFVRGDEHRDLIIPGEFVTGFNWAYADKDPDQAKWAFKDSNPDGLRKWTGADNRIRQQTARPSPSDWLNGPSRRQW